MCGIAGFLSPAGLDEAAARATLQRMTDRLRHRGPDDAGAWIDPDAGIALGHRRLAVIDLTTAGHQPMAADSGRYVLVYNGEIYNHAELRQALGERAWRGHSDTETLLAGIDAWGLRGTLQRAVGMFAIALWDRHERRLSLARDRIGEKPLYYGWQQGTLLFGSELKALRAHPSFAAGIDREALESMLRVGYVAAPRSIHAGIGKLPPGCIASFDADAGMGTREVNSYWSLEHAALQGLRQPFAGTPDEAVSRLDALLRQSLRGQMVADVPLGAFLSGGIDSSTVVALMQALSTRKVKTYTIGFDEQRYDESAHARAVARHLGTEHTEWIVRPPDALKVIPYLAQMYDEPLADSSQIPTALVAQLARRDVTVALTGDAGDELFCGYGRYPQALNGWRRLSRVPRPLRALARALLPSGKLREALACRDVDGFYRYLNRQWKGVDPLVLGRQDRDTPAPLPAGLDPMARMMAADMDGYLPDDILVKVDRAAMAVSLESRVPLLDHRIVEFAWALPTPVKFRDGTGKWPLRQLLYRHVPRELVERPKMGFGVPVALWLRGPLRDWAEDLLDPGRLRREGHLDTAAVRREWQLHLSGRADRSYGLWSVLMFQAWLTQQQ